VPDVWYVRGRIRYPSMGSHTFVYGR
jgi:hypothetical protein